MTGTDWNAAMLQWVHDLAVQGIMLTDTELTIRGWNRWLAIHSGIAAQDVIGRQLLEVYPELVTRRLDHSYRQALGGQVVVLAQRLHQYLFPMPPGEDYPGFASMQQSARIGPLVVDEQVVGTITVIDDVTERVASEAALKRMLASEQRLRAEAQEAVRVRDAFFSIATHELKTPLTSLLGHTQLLERRLSRLDDLGQRERNSLQVIVDQATRLNKMVTALLDISYLQAGKLSVDRVPMDLVALTQRVVSEAQPTLQQHTFAYADPGAPLIVNGDALRIEQVLQNLIGNAIKYSPQGGQISVRIERRGQMACIEVADQGIGIPAEALPRLFQRFYRAANVEAQHIGGMGIGLYVVRELVALHGGTVEVSSTEGAGSVFTITLPLESSFAF